MTGKMKTTRPEDNAKPGLRWLLSPWAILAGAAAGMFIGSQSPELAAALAPVGQLYLDLLKMCILPIVIAAIVSSVGKIVRSRAAARYIKLLVLVFGGSLLLAAVGGLLAGLAGRPGAGLDAEVRETLGRIIHQSPYAVDLEISFTDPPPTSTAEPSAWQFIHNLIPHNIFHELHGGNVFPVMLFFILMGIAVGSVRSAHTDAVIGFFDTVFQAFLKIVGWAMYLLPLGLCALLAEQMTQVGLDVLLAMIRFVVVFYLTALLLLAINAMVLRRVRGTPPAGHFADLKQPLIIALITRNLMVALPSAIRALNQKMKLDAEGVNLVLPIGVIINRFGNVAYFAVCMVFVAQLYQMPIGLHTALVMICGTIVAGVATCGTSGIVTLSLLGLVLTPLGLPLSAVLALFMAIDPIVDPVRTLLNTHANCAATVLVVSTKPLPAMPSETMIGQRVPD